MATPKFSSPVTAKISPIVPKKAVPIPISVLDKDTHANVPAKFAKGAKSTKQEQSDTNVAQVTNKEGVSIHISSNGNYEANVNRKIPLNGLPCDDPVELRDNSITALEHKKCGIATYNTDKCINENNEDDKPYFRSVSAQRNEKAVTNIAASQGGFPFTLRQACIQTENDSKSHTIAQNGKYSAENYGDCQREIVHDRNNSLQDTNGDVHSDTKNMITYKENKNLVQGEEMSSFGSAGIEYDPEDIGSTPWLQIEKRINQIRALASKDLKSKDPGNIEDNRQQIPNIYANYNTHYEQESEWKQEISHPLSYGMIQKINAKNELKRPKDRWNFINGFIKPRRKPFSSMSEMAKCFQDIRPQDQCEFIKLLLACRDLEKIIEEQHTVLDMLDHDLREARDLLKFPDYLSNVTAESLAGSAPEKEPFYPTSDMPLFIKGRVSLLPRADDAHLSTASKR